MKGKIGEEVFWALALAKLDSRTLKAVYVLFGARSALFDKLLENGKPLSHEVDIGPSKEEVV